MIPRGLQELTFVTLFPTQECTGVRTFKLRAENT